MLARHLPHSICIPEGHSILRVRELIPKAEVEELDCDVSRGHRGVAERDIWATGAEDTTVSRAANVRIERSRG